MTTGFFGKLPAHGDFIHRNLPSGFINLWDQWLQSFLVSSKEQLGEQWLDIYLTSPIWRFFLSPGVIDENQWAGIVLPSVDRVGRYFPFSVVTKVEAQTNPMEFIHLQKNWYEALEEVCLEALDGQMVLDELVERISGLKKADSNFYKTKASKAGLTGVVVEMDFEQKTPVTAFPHLLDAFISQSFTSYSAWTTQGSELIAPCAFVAQGLPGSSKVAAMLDGQWEHWGWHLPYYVKST